MTADGTEIIGLTPFFGADSVDGNFESYLAAVAMMDAVQSYEGPYDAVIQAGFGEHGREGLQELLNVPVVDITEAAVQPRPPPRSPLLRRHHPRSHRPAHREPVKSRRPRCALRFRSLK